MIDSGDAGYSRLINIPLNKVRQYASDPTLAPFALQADLVATEFERLMVGNGLSIAMLPVAAQESAQKLLSRDMSPAEMRAIFPTMLNDLKNTIDANNSTRQEIVDKLRAGGNSPAKTTTSTQERKKLPAGKTLSPGVHYDAKGNRIEVFADGTYREL